MRCPAVALAALVVSGGLVVSGSLAFAQTREGQKGPSPVGSSPVAPSAQPPVVTPQTQPRLDAEGYNMDKPAPPGTMGPVKKNPDPSAASVPDMGDAANPSATTGQAPPSGK